MLINSKNIDRIAICLFFFFPFLLISGPLLSEFFISIVVIFFLIFLYKKNIIKNINYNLFFFFLLFYIYININSFFSYNPTISFLSSIPYIRMILFSLAFSYFLRKILGIKKIIFISFFISYVILFLDSLFQLTVGYNVLGFPANINRISSFFGLKLVMGSFVARTLPILLAITFIEDFKNKRLVQFFLLIISGSLIFFSAERLAFAYYFIILFLFFLLTINKKNFLIYFSSLLIILPLLYFAKPSSWQRLGTHTISQFKQTSNVLGLSYRHQLHYLTAYYLYLDKKFIGHGLKSFRNLCEKENYSLENKIIKDNKLFSPIDGKFYIDENTSKLFFLPKDVLNSSNDINSYIVSPYSFNPSGKNIFLKKSGDDVNKGELVGSFYEFRNGCNTHPHNIHLEFLSELGFVGYVFLLLFFIYLIFRITKNLMYIFINISKKNANRDYIFFSIFILIGLFNSLFPLFPSGSFFNNWLSVIFYFNLGFLISNKNI